MSKIDSASWHRLAGLAGFAVLFFAGDMLFYGHWGAGGSVNPEGLAMNVRQASLE